MPEDRVPPSTPSAQPEAVTPTPGSADSSAEGTASTGDSTGAWTALAAPGKPDGEVDTRP